MKTFTKPKLIISKFSENVSTMTPSGEWNSIDSSKKATFSTKTEMTEITKYKYFD